MDGRDRPYSVNFWFVCIFLLVAMIGAIVLTMHNKRSEDLRRTWGQILGLLDSGYEGNAGKGEDEFRCTFFGDDSSGTNFIKMAG